jgi:hypothetical protein
MARDEQVLRVRYRVLEKRTKYRTFAKGVIVGVFP